MVVRERGTYVRLLASALGRLLSLASLRSYYSALSRLSVRVRAAPLPVTH